MLNIILLITILIFLSVVFYKLSQKFLFTSYVKSNIDNKYYRVKNGKNSQKAADALATINLDLQTVILKAKQNKHLFPKNVDLMCSRYSPGSLTENIDLNSTSYTMNKGDEIAFCVSTRDSEQKMYDKNLLLFVSIHELAHIGCESIGHGKEFRDFFKFLIEQAIECGVYTYIDYTKVPTEYCGMIINSTPV